VLLRLLQAIQRTLEALAERCHQIDGIYALARGLVRLVEKLRVFGAGLEGRFPLLDRLLPAPGPERGAIGERLAQMKKHGEMLDEIIALLDRLTEQEKTLEAIHAEVDAIEYEEIARVADRLYKLAFG
jgi:hypothetical protein